MSQRHEFVLLARGGNANVQELCRRFGISRKTGYKWIKRFATGGEAALADRSRRPHRSPRQCPAEVSALVVALRQSEPAWGGRTLRRRLQDLQHPSVPAASTCTEILRRAHLLNPAATTKPWQRFERATANELWQLDFKTDIAMQQGGRCHALTALDDHSRFNLLLEACPQQTGATVRALLAQTFHIYGLPDYLLCDNGPPWGCSEPVCPYTSLTVWLLQLGVRVIHGRPYHPQTQGKEERFHRTLNRELLTQHTWRNREHCSAALAAYRDKYNCVRPHQALNGDTPARHYQPSPRRLPLELPAPQYLSSDLVKRVRMGGSVQFGKRHWYVGRAFVGLPVGLRPSAQADGQWCVFFDHHHLGTIDLRGPERCSGYAQSIYTSNQV